MTVHAPGTDWQLVIALIQLVVLVGGLVLSIGVFKARMEEMAKNQEKMLTLFQKRFEEHEAVDQKMFADIQERFFDIVGGLQRLVGETSVFRRHVRGEPPR